jgi:hypothetical protein
MYDSDCIAAAFLDADEPVQRVAVYDDWHAPVARLPRNNQSPSVIGVCRPCEKPSDRGNSFRRSDHPLAYITLKGTSLLYV